MRSAATVLLSRKFYSVIRYISLAFFVVSRMISSAETPLISASFSTTYGRFPEKFRFPRFGTGARYGQSVSRTIRSSGAYSATSI